ncbi:MAG: hypothetical protein WC337_02835 [Candidatus Muiribacteriota bacterium]
MKRKIKGKIYNTGKDFKVAEWSNGIKPNDSRCIYRAIYRTKCGRWFMYQYAGAKTEHAEVDKKLKVESETIIPLTGNKALQYFKKWNRLDLINRYFPKRIELNPNHQ